jgi:hypothetical protein
MALTVELVGRPTKDLSESAISSSRFTADFYFDLVCKHIVLRRNVELSSRAGFSAKIVQQRHLFDCCPGRLRIK